MLRAAVLLLRVVASDFEVTVFGTEGDAVGLRVFVWVCVLRGVLGGAETRLGDAEGIGGVG